MAKKQIENPHGMEASIMLQLIRNLTGSVSRREITTLAHELDRKRTNKHGIKRTKAKQAV